jgi:uncharacterized protein (UPF0262 family)
LKGRPAGPAFKREEPVTELATETGGRLVAITLDEQSIEHVSPEVEHERRVAIFDLIEENSFYPLGHEGGEFSLKISMVACRLVMEINRPNGAHVVTHIMSLTPFRRLVRDYFTVCDTYYQAIRTQSPSQIEAIDMGRRGLHDEGANVLMEKLIGKIAIDMKTARRLFTLVAVLLWRGNACR